MRQLSLVIGQAGTGKTTWLTDKARECAPALLTTEHQSVLAITRMHGARRRMKMKLLESCPSMRCSVATIDGFALSILNRWRTALGHAKPLQAVEGDIPFVDTVFGTEADFARVLSAAAGLLRSPMVRRVIGETYPLIIVDEFQDCHGPLLDFVKVLCEASTVLLAADEFQLLDAAVVGCPATEWIRSLEDDANTEVMELNVCHRTSVQGILRAASCLRSNTPANGQTIPMFYCPREGPVAWKIIETLVCSSRPWRGTTVLICPSHDPFLYKVIESATHQLKKKGLVPIRWHEETAAEKEQEQIRSALGLATANDATTSQWTAPMSALDPIGIQVAERTQRFARLRGLQTITHDVVDRHIDIVIHEKRAYCSHCPPKTVTTVHGAKNREFDNVFILWTYKLPPDQEQQRKLLYNAITRAKQNCMLLVLGNEQRFQSDPVLSLLGLPQPVFSQTARAKTRTTKKVASR